MKKITSVLCIILLFSLCTSCSGKKVEKWSKADFSFYDKDGKEKAFLTEKTRGIDLSDYEYLQTKRGVEIGDKAIEALMKYDLKKNSACVFFEYSILKQLVEVDLESEIKKASVDGETISVIVFFDDNFSPCDATKLVKALKRDMESEGKSDLSPKHASGIEYLFMFEIVDEAIMNIFFGELFIGQN